MQNGRPYQRFDLNHGAPLSARWSCDVGGFHGCDGGRLEGNATHQTEGGGTLRLYASFTDAATGQAVATVDGMDPFGPSVTSSTPSAAAAG